MEETLKEMLGKRPDELEGETLKLFETIMKIADERDKLKVKNKEYEECLEVTSLALNNIAYDQIPIAIEDLKLSSIPKSKVKENIEELDIKITYIESQYTNGGQNCDSDYLSALYQKQVLQELLEE